MSPTSLDLAARIGAAAAKARGALLAERGEAGHWVGELSTSALSTATAVTALAVCVKEASDLTHPSGEPNLDHSDGLLIRRGLEWLAQNQNPDGGWGDTTRSLSNLSTTALGWAAFGALPGADSTFAATVQAAAIWLEKRAGGLEPTTLARAIIARYGKDRTFSVPILTLCALAGRLGHGPAAWEQVIPLPFELAALPHQLFAAVQLPVVSYALPALIAIGQVRYAQRPPRNPLVRVVRGAARARTLRVLEQIQPSNGGFLEATPLTSFVVMSLAGAGQRRHPVTERGLAFLRASVRPDGSWPIDTNLATWVTTLSINALGSSLAGTLEPENGVKLTRWLLGQQYTVEHPYTHAPPGAWAWTDLPGGVPDADDTAGALLALRVLGAERCGPNWHAAGARGVEWLLNLQNRDGGVPTFCRGWGALPFDRSGADLTAHAIRAWLAWADALPGSHVRIETAIRRAMQYLAREQRPDGSWLPLWFGNQFGPDDENPIYGTARVLEALNELAGRWPDAVSLRARGRAFFWRMQNRDGSWGRNGAESGTVEETALALGALADGSVTREEREPLERGGEWLAGAVESGRWREPAPIGFYFAKLWYFERLYPAIFTVAALEKLARHWPESHPSRESA